MPKCRINLYDICHTLELGISATFKYRHKIYKHNLNISGASYDQNKLDTS